MVGKEEHQRETTVSAGTFCCSQSLGWNLRQAVIPMVMLMAACVYGGAAEVTIMMVEGDDITGPLEAVSAESVAAGGKKAVMADIAGIAFSGAINTGATGKHKIILRNGDVLNALLGSGNDTALLINSSVLGELKLKNDILRGVIFPIKAPPSKGVVASFFSGKDPDQDRILTPKGNTVKGFMEKFSDTELVFDTEGQKQKYAYDKLAAFRYAALEAFKPAQGVIAKVRLSDGSILSGVLSGFADGKLGVTGAGGMAWSLPTTAILGIEFSGGKLVYLSELEPKVEQKPLVGGAPVVFAWRKDASVIGEKLRIAGKDYARGVGVQSYSKLSYALEGQYARFIVDVGMNASANPGAVCAWKILADGKPLKANEAKAGDVPQKMKVPVEGVKVLELICDYGSDLDDAGDHFNWADARLIRK